jgi:serine/threonine-protein kinase
MAIASLNDLLDALRKYHLLEQRHLEKIGPQLQGKNLAPSAVCQRLIQQGWLTAYQANQLLQGKVNELVLGSYVLLERLGEGGMGTVYKARNWKLGHIVAVKVMRKERVANEQAVRRFEREIRAAAQLDHQNIVKALDADAVSGTHLFVMDYVAGTDLFQFVKSSGPLPVAHACEYMRQAACGLAHAHARGMVHRDIKPHNLLVAKAHGSPSVGLLKILDFGLTRMLDDDESHTLTQEGCVVGTIDYVAPEQAMNSHGADIRADLYSLGATFYFLLTGVVPFPGGTAMEKLSNLAMREPMPVEQLRQDVPAGVAALVRKLMAKRPEDRFQTPAEVATLLAKGAAVPVVSMPRAGTGSRLPVAPVVRPPLALPIDAEETIIAGATPSEAMARGRRRGLGRRWLLFFSSGGIFLLLALVALGVTWLWRPGDRNKGKTITGTTPAAVNIIQDPGFETPQVGTGTHAFAARPAGSPWTFTGGAGVAGNGCGYTGGNPNAPQGTQVAFLQGTPSRISQTVQFKAGAYTLSFQAARRASFGNNQTFQVRIDDAVVGKFTTSGTNYVTMTTDNFTVEAGAHTITFEGLNPLGGDNTALIDMVTLSSGSPSPSGEMVWVDDATPPGAMLESDGGDAWTWITDNPKPYSGKMAHQSNIAAGSHQHYFKGAMEKMSVGSGDRLFAYVYLDPANTPSEVMLQWHTASLPESTSWEHRAYWGANNLTYGNDGNDSRRFMGPLPAAGRWVRLEVPASAVGLEGLTVDGMSFALFGGRATWDRAGKVASTTPPPTDDRITNSIGMKLKPIPAGKFTMGSPPNEPGRGKDEDPHEVEIAKPFYIGVHAITVAQFRQFVLAKGYLTEAERNKENRNWQQPGFASTDDHPVVYVTWNDAVAFCDWLSQKEGKKYALPTEAQWEYSCRAGSQTLYYFGNDSSKLPEHAWFNANSGGQPRPVGQFKPNVWGLHDLHGNVWQWVADWYAVDYYQKSPKADPPGPADGRTRVLRGGSYVEKAEDIRSARRNGENGPLLRHPNVGFRVVLLSPR